MIDLQLIASLVGGLILTYFVSREESKPAGERIRGYDEFGQGFLREIYGEGGIPKKLDLDSVKAAVREGDIQRFREAASTLAETGLLPIQNAESKYIRRNFTGSKKRSKRKSKKRSKRKSKKRSKRR